MARQLKDQQKTELTQALDAFIKAGEALVKAPKFSHRADLMIDRIANDINVAKKLKSEVDPSSVGLPDNPPDRPDSGRGDFDNSQSSTPRGLTSTHSMASERGMANKQSKPGGMWSHGPQDEESDQARHDGPRETAPNLTPGLSGHPMKKDDRERHTEYTVDSTSHREAAKGEYGRVDPDILPGPAKRQPGSEMSEDSDREDESTKSGPLHGDDNTRYQGPKGSFDQEKANISVPIKQGADTTNTSSEGAPWPDNAFAKDAGDFYQRQDDDDKQADASRAEELQRKAATSRKYDSENRVATETLGHAAEKARQAGAEANQPGTSKSNAEVQGDQGSNQRSADDKLGLTQEERQAQVAADTNQSRTALEQQSKQGDRSGKPQPHDPTQK